MYVISVYFLSIFQVVCFRNSILQQRVAKPPPYQLKHHLLDFNKLFLHLKSSDCLLASASSAIVCIEGRESVQRQTQRRGDANTAAELFVKT